MGPFNYYVCDYCGKTCKAVDCLVEEPYYDPYYGVAYREVEGLQSHCCEETFDIKRTLPLTKRAKMSLLKKWNKTGNAEIINHIQNVLETIGEVCEQKEMRMLF